MGQFNNALLAIKIFTRCKNMNQYDILITDVNDVCKGQTYMQYKDELQTLTKLIGPSRI